MDHVSYFLVSILLFGICLEFSEAQDGNNATNTSTGLKCYFCADTGVNNRCEDFNTYKIAMDNEGNEEVKKVCKHPFNKTCAIETYQTKDGGQAAQIRDCSDGETFAFKSFAQDDHGAYNRLKNLTTNNETACVWDNNNLVCLSQCETNYCNGPILEEVTDGSTLLAPSYIMMLVLFLITFTTI